MGRRSVGLLDARVRRAGGCSTFSMRLDLDIPIHRRVRQRRRGERRRGDEGWRPRLLSQRPPRSPGSGDPARTRRSEMSVASAAWRRSRLAENERLLRRAVQVRDDFLLIASHELKTPLTPLLLELASAAKLDSQPPRDSRDGPPELPAQLERKLTKAVGHVERFRLPRGSIARRDTDDVGAAAPRAGAARPARCGRRRHRSNARGARTLRLRRAPDRGRGGRCMGRGGDRDGCDRSFA